MSFFGPPGLRSAALTATQRDRLLEMVRSRVQAVILGDKRYVAILEELARRVGAREIDPYSAAEELLQETGFLVPHTQE